MKVLGRIFLNSRKERRKDGKTEFFVRCRRTYVLNNESLILTPKIFFGVGVKKNLYLYTRNLLYQYLTPVFFNKITFVNLQLENTNS